MTQWVITSSLLILVIVLLRYALKGNISLRLQYALWMLVLIRLLVPVSFGSSRVSVMNAVDGYENRRAVSGIAASVSTSNAPQVSDSYYEKKDSKYESSSTQASLSGADNKKLMETKESNSAKRIFQTKLTASLLYILWLTGASVVGLWLMIANLGYALKLKRTRITIDISNYPLKVYSSDMVESSCLFGLFKPAIYISNKDLESELVLNYVLEHEITHFRHLDHVWSFMRCLCMAVHWYNPLVWWAASLSKQDAELACDEATIRKIGEDSRSAYGRTLIELTCSEKRKGNLIIAATTMSGSKKRIKERIAMIAKRPVMAFYTFILVLFIAAVAIGCIFTGPRKSTATNTKVFTDKIAVSSIIIKNKLGKEETLDDKYLSEMIKWTQDFTYGEKCTDSSLALMNEYYITVNYVDGTSITSGIDFAEKDGEKYYVDRKGLPEYWGYITRKIDRTRTNISNYVYDVFNSGGSIKMSIDVMDEKSYETLNFNELRDAERFATLFDDYDYIRVTNPYIKNGTPSAALVSGDGTKEMIFWNGEKTTVMYNNGKSKQYWSAVASRNNYRGWNLGTLLEEMYDEYVYKYNFAMPEIAFSISGDAKKAASAFAYKIYREQYFDKLPPSSSSIKDYKVINFSIKEISDDGKAVIGQLNYAVMPIKNNYACLWFGRPAEDEGEYKGWVVPCEQFVLQKQEDGLWHCIGIGTGGAELP